MSPRRNYPKRRRPLDDDERDLTPAIPVPGRAGWRAFASSKAPDRGAYRCPGCDHTIAHGETHVVAWRADDEDATHRRHWHNGCWRRAR